MSGTAGGVGMSKGVGCVEHVRGIGVAGIVRAQEVSRWLGSVWAPGEKQGI